VNEFLVLLCLCTWLLLLPIKLSLPQPMSFLAFTLPILSPHPTVGERASGCVVLNCCLDLNQDTFETEVYRKLGFLLCYFGVKS